MTTMTFSTQTGTAAVLESPDKRFSAHFEQWYPWFFGLTCAAVVFVINPPDKVVYDALQSASGSAVSAAAILAGFQGTGLGLLLALLGTETVKTLNKAQLFNQLVDYQWHAILLLLLMVGVLVGLLAVQGVVPEFGGWSRWIASGLAFFATSAILAGFRVTRLMVMILKGEAKSRKRRAGKAS